MDESLLEAAITDKTKAVMPVSIYGQCPDMDPINAIAEKYNLPAIEDAAQGFGATYKVKNPVICLQLVAHPSSPLNHSVVMGMRRTFTNDDELAEKFRWIRVHGQERKHHHQFLVLMDAWILFRLPSYWKSLRFSQTKLLSVRRLEKDTPTT